MENTVGQSTSVTAPKSMDWSVAKMHKLYKDYRVRMGV